MKIVRSEFLKIFTLRTWWVLIIIMFAYVGFTAAILGGGMMLASDLAGSALLPSQSSAETAQMTYSTALSVGYVFPVLLGALSITGEYRFGTIIPTFLLTPKRSAVLWAKLLTQFVMGLIYGVIGFATTILASVFFLMRAEQNIGLTDISTWGMIVRGILAMGIWAMIGVGLGVLIRNQAAAIIIAIAFTQFLEPILRFVALFNEATVTISKFLPGAASDAIGGASVYSMTSFNGTGGATSLPWWGGALVLLGYAGLTALIGYWTRWTRDAA
jgi:hypothetical protein